MSNYLLCLLQNGDNDKSHRIGELIKLANR